ncbi:hypothetical protein CLIM01_02978 [Colletotrichum limetticola]|uniref:C2H2-type domain-containing protein n=1 Tax=Colletotrichum limetticola TaxID=1209924 RepID=A0ABQ9Q7H2_9PEZI|nr:hypothetical protein CLIM01_02978 [Colletotrichum limetticola]
MASYADPPVQDRWDSHDFDGDPDRYLCFYNMSDEFDLDAWATPDPRVTTMVDMGDAFALEMELHRSTLNPVKFEKTNSPFDGGSSDDGGYPLPRLLTFRERRRLPVQLLLRKSRHAPIACGKCREDMIASCSLSSRDKLASVRLSDLATMEDICVLDFVTPVPVSPDDGQTAHLDIPDTCRQVSFGKLNGVMQLLSVAVGQGPEYVVKLLDRPSELDSARPQEFTQTQPFVNQLAQQIAESTTLYQYEPYYQQPSTPETEFYDLSAATNIVGRLPSENTTHHPGFPPSVAVMAVTTSGWPYGAQPVRAAPDAMNDSMYQNSPFSELFELSDEGDDWAMLMQQDMLATGDYDMTTFDPSTMEPTYQTTHSPQEIFNDPAVQFDVAQSLGPNFFDFNSPLPDLSTSGYLSGDQVSSYLGSTNTSPFEPVLDFFPETDSFSMFPASTDGSPLDTTFSSPGSDSANAPSSSSHPYSCTTDGCTKTFAKEAQLKQHQRVHRKALVCTICRAEHRHEHKFAQVRDLERHMQARHKDVAEKNNVRSEIRQCPHQGCEHQGRRDNVSRHHKSKHGKELKWKRGVPHVVG